MARKRKEPISEPEPEPQQPLEQEQEEEEQIEQQQEEEIEQKEQQQEEIEQEEEEEPTEDQQPETQTEPEGETEAAEEEEEEENESVEEEELEEEPIEKLLEPFSKEQLTVLLKEVIAKHPEFIESVNKIAEVDPSRRKIFVHGLGWDTTSETLVSEFSKYGPIEDCKAVTDKVSGKSKGYAFILFKSRIGARKALIQPQKLINNRMTSCQLASAGPVPAPPPTATFPMSELTQRKIFVSNVSPDIDPNELMDFFAKFGEIEDGPLGLDKTTGKPKGFALFVYKNVESAKKALEEPHKSFEGHTLHCQQAIDGPKQYKANKPHFQPHYNQNKPSYNNPYKKGKYGGGGGGGPSGHMMAPSGGAQGGFNAAQALTPALGQALTALLASPGGISNLLGGLGGGVPGNQGVAPMMNNAGYGNQGGYGGQGGMQGGYQNQQMGQGGNRPPQGGGGYMGHGH